MKIKNLIALIITLASLSTIQLTWAQKTNPVGVKIGLNLSSVSNNGDVPDGFSEPLKGGINIGFAFESWISPLVRVAPEIGFSQRGFKIKGTAQDNNGVEFDILDRTTFNYIEIPLMVRVKLSTKPRSIYFNGGPSVAYWMGGKGKGFIEVLDDNGQIVKEEYKYRIRPSSGVSGDDVVYIANANRLEVGLVGGIGYAVEHLRWDIRYFHGLTNVVDRSFETALKNSKNSYFSASLIIFLKH